MNMLDPTSISDPDNYSKEDFRNKGLVIRRFKKDIQSQVDKGVSIQTCCPWEQLPSPTGGM